MGEKYKNIVIIFLSFLAFVSIVLNLLLIGKIGKNWQDKTNKNNRSKRSDMVRVINVVDGDTFDIDDGNRIRLALIDAPEYPKGCYSSQAKDRLKNLLLGKEISFEVLKKDNFGRILAFVFLNDLLINKVLVAEGYAFYSPLNQQTKYDVELIQTEKEAKEAKRGIWSSACQNPNSTGNCHIKGNVRKDNNTKTYHLPGCYNYDKIVINPSLGDRWFCTEEEATRAGFIKSKDCP